MTLLSAIRLKQIIIIGKNVIMFAIVRIIQKEFQRGNHDNHKNTGVWWSVFGLSVCSMPSLQSWKQSGVRGNTEGSRVPRQA
jgi:hypothetical protein